MRYSSIQESQDDHIKRYRTDGFLKGKGTRYSPDYHRVKFLLDNTPKESYVLDVGCNTGTVAIPLTQLGCYVKGIDIVPELVEKAIRRGIPAEIGTAENLSRFDDNEFDVVICAEVLEHLYDPLPAIQEAYRVLKPGGKYLVTIPHSNSLMAGDKLGDYHQQNFSMEILDTLFYCVFERGKVFFVEIPYIDEYCKANGVPKGMYAWFGLECLK